MVIPRRSPQVPQGPGDAPLDPALERAVQTLLGAIASSARAHPRVQLNASFGRLFLACLLSSFLVFQCGDGVRIGRLQQEVGGLKAELANARSEVERLQAERNRLELQIHLLTRPKPPSGRSARLPASPAAPAGSPNAATSP